MRYAARKLLTLLVTMVVVSFLTFAAFDLISGDPATAMLGTQATPETVAALRAQLGLDAPLPVRYSQWLLGFFNGDLGMSFQYRLPVRELLLERMEEMRQTLERLNSKIDRYEQTVAVAEQKLRRE